MKKYQSDATSYNAIVEAMQQIRQNALAENYSEDEMEEAHCMEDEEMEEGAHEDMEEGAHEDMDEGAHDDADEGAHDEATLYEMDGEMYMEMHGEQGAMKYMLVPMMDEGAHEMEEEVQAMQEQEEPEHTIMYKGVKYVQA